MKLRRGTALSRAAAVALLLCLAVAVFGIFESIWREHKKTDELIGNAEHQMERYSEHRKDIRQLRSTLEQYKRNRKSDKTFLRAETDTLAAARLISHIKKVARSEKESVSSVQILKIDESAEFPKITLRAQMKVTPKGLLRILYRLESGQPYLLVDNVMIVSRPVKMSVKGKGENSQSWEKLYLEFRYDISGYLWKDVS